MVIHIITSPKRRYNLKHYKICILIFILVLLFTFFIDYKTTSTLNNLLTSTEILINDNDILENSYEYQNIKNTFYENKNMLLIQLNKEHIKDINILINDLNLSFDNNDSEKAKEIALKLHSYLIYSKSNIFSII